MTAHPAPPPTDGPAIRAAIVGVEAGPRRADIDARWLMAYAAGAGARHARFFDTTAAEGPLAHPLFAVCYEWPLMVAIRCEAIGEAAAFGVHASHRLVLHRLPRAGDQLSTRARVMAVSPRRAGTLVAVRLVTSDQSGETVSETDYGSFFRGVPMAGPASVAAPAPRRRQDAGLIRWSEPIEVPYHTGHVYTECARIWNPIHTDLAAARAAGLPGPILHGTATLALTVSRLIERDLAGEAALVRGIAGRFTGMVPLPSTIVVRAGGRRADGLAFDVVTVAGAPLISEGVLHL